MEWQAWMMLAAKRPQAPPRRPPTAREAALQLLGDNPLGRAWMIPYDRVLELLEAAYEAGRKSHEH